MDNLNGFNPEKHEAIKGGFQAKSVAFDSVIREISYSAFRERFNIASKLKVEEAIETDALVRLLEKDLQARGIDGKPIRLDSDDLVFGLNKYNEKGLLVDGLTVEKLLRNGTENEVL